MGDLTPAQRLRQGQSYESPRNFIQYFYSRSFLIGLVAVGAALRLWQYAGNTSLDIDELALARNVLDRPLGTLLFTPLLFDQVAPLGFLLAEKTSVGLFGTSEYALRLFPLVCSLTSLVLFWYLAVHVLHGLAVPMAIALFAFKPSFILYGSTVKQYFCDLAAVLLLTLLAIKLWRSGTAEPRWLLVGVVGMMVAQCSQAAVFVLLGIGLALVLLALTEQRGTALSSLAITVGLWVVGAAVAVGTGLQNISPGTHAYMRSFWRGGFMPLPSSWDSERIVPWLKNVGPWLWNSLYSVLDLEGLHSGWYAWPGLYMGLAVLGMWALWHRGRDALLIIVGPVIATLAASAAQQYPVRGRLTMFLAPSLLILAAEGAERLRQVWPARLIGVGAVAMVLLTVLPVYDLASHLPVYRREETKPMFAYVASRRLPSDAIYVYYGAWQAVSFYGPRYGFREDDYVIGGCHRGDLRSYLEEVDQFRGQQRVWVLISHALPHLKELSTIISYLDRIGVQRDSLAIPSRIWYEPPSTANVYAYLYDLSDETRLASVSAETFLLPSLPRVNPRAAIGCWAGPQVPVAHHHLEYPKAIYSGS